MSLFSSVLWDALNPLNFVKSLMLYSGGGGGGGNTTQTSYSTNLPEYAKPYYEELLKQTGLNVFTTDAKGNVTGVKDASNLPKQTIAQSPTLAAAQGNILNYGGTGQDVSNAVANLGYGTQQGYNAMNQGFNQAFNYQPTNYNAQQVNAPTLQDYSMQAATSNWNPNLQQYSMTGPANVSARDIAAQTWGGQTAQQYQDPYQQGVTDIALREARKQGALDRQAGALGSMNRGTFGGARQALLQAEQQRNLNQNLADIQAKGSAQGYANAQQQFNADQARAMQAAQANQQYGLQAAMANQQAGLTTGQQNLAAQLATQQLGANTGVQMALANLNNQQAANQQNLAARLATQQLGAGQNLTAQQLNQAAGLQAAQLNQQGQQYAAGLGKDIGLAGLTAGMQGSAQAADIAAKQQVADLQRLQAQATTAQQQQDLQQRINDINYQNAMAQQNYQKQQIQFYSDILRGNASALGSTQVNYAPAPSMVSQLGGLGLAGLGLAKAI